MAETNTNGEATPQTNTAQAPVKINPIEFPQGALENLLNRQLLGAQEEQVETPVAEVAKDDPTETQSSEETVEAESDDSDTDAHSQSEEVTEADQEAEEEPSRIQKRFDKLTARAKEAEERAEAAFKEAEAIKQRLQELEQKTSEPVAAATSDNRFADVWDAEKLKHEKAIAYNLVEWCEDNRDGAEVNGTEYSSEQIRAIRKNAKRTLDIQIPEREAFLAHYNQVKPQVESLYPFWKDRSSSEYTEAQQILKILPQLKMHPEYQVWIGDALEGRKVRLAKQSAPKKTVTASRPAPKQPSQPKAAPARIDSEKEKVKAKEANFYKSGSERALAELLQTRY